MQVVIEIPECVKQDFDRATEDDIHGCYYDYNGIIGRAIKNGVPLPKGNNGTIDYRRAFKIACELLNGDILYGVDSDAIFEIIMERVGFVCNESYEEYILNHLQELDHGQYAER